LYLDPKEKLEKKEGPATEQQFDITQDLVPLVSKKIGFGALPLAVLIIRMTADLASTADTLWNILSPNSPLKIEVKPIFDYFISFPILRTLTETFKSYCTALESSTFYIAEIDNLIQKLLPQFLELFEMYGVLWLGCCTLFVM
jgi:hypothetical protein